MRYFVLRRIAQMVILLLFISALIYVVLNFVPGGPFDSMRFSNPRITAEHVEQLERLLGLDRPLHERYLSWLVSVLRGDWGVSWGIATGQPITEIIKSRLGNTLALMGISLTVSVIIAILIGIYSAIRQYSLIDYIVTSLSFLGMSLPTFWLGIMMLIVFSVGLRWLPAGGVSTPGLEGDLVDRLRHLALPVAALSLFNIAGWSRYIRSSMLEVLGQDFLRTAKAKGLTQQTILIKHALRNALIPIITLIGLTLPELFGGAIITETIFAYSGMGVLYYNAVVAGDWPLVQAIMVILAFLVVASNLLADILYAVADPRIRFE